MMAALLMLVSSASSQEGVDSVLAPVSRKDTATFVPLRTLQGDTTRVEDSPTKSPGLALLFSAVLPGAGQFYNESYWKVPILLGFGYYLASQWLDNNDSTKHYRDLFARSVAEGNEITRYQQLREFYKDQRDTFSWYIFIYYIVNLVDAYVDASLYDFNVGDDLSIRVVPEFSVRSGSSSRVKLTITF